MESAIKPVPQKKACACGELTWDTDGKGNPRCLTCFVKIICIAPYKAVQS